MNNTDRAVYFVSDLHLGSGSKEENTLRENVFLHFLDCIKNRKNELIIAGDLFDCWIEYKYVVPKGHYRLLSKFHEMREEGMEITLMAGNHDFWRGTYFRDEFNMDFIYADLEKVIDGKKFYVHHGDDPVKKDTGYKIMKKILRNRVSQFLYYFLHPDAGIKLAQITSKLSRKKNNKRDFIQVTQTKPILNDLADRKFKEGYDYVIMGHSHRPVKIQQGDKIYINLGDWITNFTYSIYQDGKLKLMKYYDVKENKYLDGFEIK